MTIKSYKDLIVWQKSMELCVEVYKVTEKYPKSEIYGLTLQTRKCTVSIPSNIAEGSKRGHKVEYIHFLTISYGSGAELETQLIIGQRVGYLDDGDFNYLSAILEEVMKMLNGLLNSLDRK